MENHLQACLYVKTGIPGDCKCEKESSHYLKLTLISLGLFLGEFIGGWFTGSLSLISDSFHVLADGTENVISVIVSRFARASADEQKLRRRGGYASAALLSMIALWIIYEARNRLLYYPREINSVWMIVIAAIGLAVNSFQLRLHLTVPREHKNVTHWWQSTHLVSDTLASITVILAGIAVFATGKNYIDPLASFGIGGTILFVALRRLLVKPRNGHGHRHSH